MTATTDYVETIEAWRAAADAALRQNWVGLAGLFELHAGSNSVGTAPDSAVLLPADGAPAVVGDFHFEDGATTLSIAPGVEVRINGKVVTGTVAVRSDEKDAPDVIAIGALTLLLIVRGPRTMVRVRDDHSPMLARFSDRRWYAVDPAWRVEAVFTPYDPPKALPITNILCDTTAQWSPGFVRFTLDGQEHRLDATGSRDGALLLHFRDATNRDLTYGGGRNLLTEPVQGQFVVIDFNRTANLNCAVTEYATCPLPPPQNTLGARIEAGGAATCLPLSETLTAFH